MIRSTAICFLGLFFLQPQGKAGEKYFPPDAVIDVSKVPYLAIPDDGKDDTESLQRAITDHVGKGRSLYFPAGVYNLRDQLLAKDQAGHWEAHLTLQGQDRDRTVIKLEDSAKGFGDPAHPKAMIVTASHWGDGDDPSGGGNKAFRNNILDLTLDTGSGNAGAMAIEYAVSNQGSIRDVKIRSGDGKGVAGIAMLRRIPGPGMIRNVEIDGFDTGIDTGDLQYGLTVENVGLTGQKVAGIRTSDNLLHIRKLKSLNAVPALWATGEGSVISLIDSDLKGKDSNQAAMISQGTILVRNVQVEGYAVALRWRGQDLAGPLRQFSGPPAVGAEGGGEEGMLAIEDAPVYWNQAAEDWESVGDRREGEKDDTAAIQRALDSGKRTIYFRNTRDYHISGTLIVRGKVKQVLGFGAEITLGAAKMEFGNRDNPRSLFRVDPTESKEVFFEDLFFNAQYPGEVLFENNSPATVVIQRSMGWVGNEGHRRSYRNTEKGTGKLFLEDLFLPGWAFENQRVWARQLNPENPDSDGSTMQVSNVGGELWILGFKTEGAAPFIFTGKGGRTELLGAYNYISATHREQLPTQSVPYLTIGGESWLTFATDNFRKKDYQVYIQSGTGDQMKSLAAPDLPPRGGPSGPGSWAVPLYKSSPTLLNSGDK